MKFTRLLITNFCLWSLLFITVEQREKPSAHSVKYEVGVLASPIIQEKEGVPGKGYDYPHLKISGEVSRHWINLENIPKNRQVALDAAKVHLKMVMSTLKDKSILQDIENQLANDSEKLGKELKINVKFEIQEDNYWLKLVKVGALTFCGDPVTIYVNIETLTNIKLEKMVEVIIHELLHAKDCVYKDVGKPSPYPKGHNDPNFKKKAEELGKKAGI